MDNPNPQGKGEAIGLSPLPLAWLRSTQAIQSLIAEGVNADGSLKPETILALLRFLGIGLADIGDQHDVSRQFVQRVITREKRSPRIEEDIAVRLQMLPEVVWGRR